MTTQKKTSMIGFKATPETRAKLEAIAKAEDRTISYIINRILEKELANYTTKSAQDFAKNAQAFITIDTFKSELDVPETVSKEG